MEKADEDPLGYFYLLIKLIKAPIARHPICSNCGSLPHALSHWVNAILQPIVKEQALYFKNLVTMKLEQEELDIPPNASLFIYDTVVMYPSINTANCLAQLLEYLSNSKVPSKYGLPLTALLKALIRSSTMSLTTLILCRIDLNYMI
jgi:hypothetical protein